MSVYGIDIKHKKEVLEIGISLSIRRYSSMLLDSSKDYKYYFGRHIPMTTVCLNEKGYTVVSITELENEYVDMVLTTDLDRDIDLSNIPKFYSLVYVVPKNLFNRIVGFNQVNEDIKFIKLTGHISDLGYVINSRLL